MPVSNPIEATRQPVISPPQVSIHTNKSQELPQHRVAHHDDSPEDISEAETLGCSSPDLPPLSAPVRVGFTPRTPQSASFSPEGAYYTASWGSPYDLSHIPAGRHSSPNRRASSANSLDELDEDSPHIAFGLSHLIPSRLTETAFDVTPARPSTPTGWSPSQDTPRLSSISPTDPEAVKIVPRDLFASLSSVKTASIQAGPRRSIPRAFEDIGFLDKPRAVKGHRSHSRNRTLRQEDIIVPTITKMDSSKYASPSDRAGSASRDTPTKAPATQTNSTTASPQRNLSINDVSGPAVPIDRGLPSKSAASVSARKPLRTKKRVAYKGKTCWVNLPVDPPRGGVGEAPYPLSINDVASKLKRLEEEGYDVAGFDHEENVIPHPSDTLAARTQTCALFPLPIVNNSAEKGPKASVRIPNIKEWQAYVNELKEAKLRALGVSLGDEPGEQPPSLSRVPSSQFSGMPLFSPPLPTSSAGSHRMGPSGAMFPLGFIPGSSHHTSTRSIASPMSSMSNPRQSMHMHRQSMFISPPLSQQTMSPPGFQSWSPQPFGFSNAPISATSPGFSSGAADMRSPVSPFNSFVDGSTGFSFPQRSELVAQLHNQKQQQIMRQSQILPIRPSSTLAEVPEAESDEDVPARSQSTQPELFNPRPGHRHNISEKLEENLSKNITEPHQPTLQDVQDDIRSPTVEQVTKKSAVPEWRKAAPVVISDTAKPQTSPIEPAVASPALPSAKDRKAVIGRTYGLDYSEAAFSDMETNPSDFGFSSPAQPKMNTSTSSNPWANDPTFRRKSSTDSKQSHASQHTSKLSLTGLNVEAKPFTFNPKANPAAIFNPSIFSASSFGFKPENVQPFIPRSMQSNTVSPPVFSKSVNTPSKPKFNIDAPEFSPSGFGSAALSKSEFAFASGPVLKPTAPAFEPGAPAIVSDGAFASSVSSESNRLFGNINFDQFAKQEKKSKAIPILPIKSEVESEHEVVLDEDGRAGQGFSKRTRRGGDDGEDVPRFAMPDSLAPDLTPKQPVVNVREPAADVKESTVVSELEEGELVEDERASMTLASEGEGATPAEEEDSLFEILGGKKIETAPDMGPRNISPVHVASEETVIPPRVSSLPQKPDVSPDLFPSSPPAAQIDDSTQLTQSFMSEEDEKAGLSSELLISPPSSDVAPKPSADADYAIAEQDNSVLSSPLKKQSSAVRYFDGLEQPSFQEIDAIMKQFNDADSDFGVERDLPSWPETSPGSLQTARPLLVPNALRSAAPSPSPRRRHLDVRPQELDSASVTQDPFSDIRAAGQDSPVRRLNADEAVPVSDWNDFSSGDEERIRERGSFLDSHVSELIDTTLGKRLDPLEKQLQAITTGMRVLSSALSGHGASSRAALDSDADDEDEDFANGIDSRAWSRSPTRDRKSERMRAVIQDVLSNHRPQADTLTGADASITILDALNELKNVVTAHTASGLQEHIVKSAIEAALVQQPDFRSNQNAGPQIEDIRAVIEAALSGHANTVESSRTSVNDESNVLTELLQKNAEAVSRAAEESEARKSAERREAESSKSLKLAEQELALLRETVKDNNLQLASHEEKTRIAVLRVVEVEANSAELQAKIDELSEINVARKAAIEEYRISHDKWRADVESLHREKEKLAGMSSLLKLQAEEAVRIRETMSDRLQKLSEDTVSATSKLADERAKWHIADSEYRSRLNYWKDKAEAERVTRENFERKIDGIEALDRENMKLRHLLEAVTHDKQRLQADVDTLLIKEREGQKHLITLEHLKSENTKLEAFVDKVRNESQQHEQAAEKYARASREAKDFGTQEVQRTRILLQTEVEAANSRVSRLQVELENALTEAHTARAKEELILKQEADTKREAIREVTESKTAALAEQKQSYEERLEEMRRQHRRDLDHVIENKNQSETFLREAHAQRLSDTEQQNQRTLEQAYEDKERSEAYLSERLELAESKVQLLEDKISLVTSKFQTAQSAAQAAAQLAQNAKGTVIPQAPIALPSMTGAMSGSSAAALRESLQVLQDQLQERELRIESLESDLEKVDDSLPEKLRARDVEVSWLRELLGVRLDDLSELCDLLNRDDYDREAVRNAAIRLKTGLKMNIQERESQTDGNAALSNSAANLATSIQNFATPRAAQLARVIGEWRSSPARRTSQASSGFLSGLMTPPATNFRRTPEPPNTVELRRGSSTSTSSRPQLNLGQPISARQQEKSRATFPALSLKETLHNDSPRTPPLLNPHGYDDDAETGRYSASGYYDDEESTVDGTPRRTGDSGES